MMSNKNTDMNSPGLRYYHLWDDNANTDGYPNRIGKVFPDQQIIAIDDDEIIAAMSYKSNRNWTLPSPKLGLITPNTCGTSGSIIGLLTGSSQTLYVTYLLNNTTAFTNSLHCNYYSSVAGPNLNCTSGSSQNVSVRFGSEFNCLSQPSLTGPCINSCTSTQGFYASKFQILCQLVNTGSKPQSNNWKIIDYTNNLTGSTINGFITQSGLTGNTFIIDAATYNAAPTYNLNTYITLPTVSNTGTTLNFGDEYYFYGSLETDIQATIYEMNYKINLGQSQFQYTSNPTWTKGTKSYITEIGLFDDNKNLIAISKLQSPILRQGIQQIVVKFDF